ncbi:MAG: hypothetical protein H0T45_02065, partial [Pyrinomonadaceae bacterium]|nr:hypothetical protein [Pyrinomonadaceae bacterium]
FPAVSFCLYRDGRPALRVVNEYTAVDFQASRTRPACRIGASYFQLEESGAERRFRLMLDEPLRGGQRLRGTFTWEMIEGDYVRVDETPGSGGGAHSHEWNLVAPRCRVSGSYNVGGQEQQAFGQKQFAGVGYHDHNRDQRWLPATVASWQWGRAHFPDATVVFYRYREIVEQIDSTRVFLIRRDQLSRHAAVFTSDRARRHHFGVRFSRAIEIAFEEQTKHLTLHVNQQKIVDASYFYLRFLGDATLTLGDNRTQHAPAITEHLAPRALRWRWLDWLTDMRIGRHGRASFLP